MKILAITAPFPGVKRVLEEGQKLKLWDLLTLTPEMRSLPDADLFIFGAWHPIYEHIIEQLYKAKRSIVVLWTSSGGEIGLEPIEVDYLEKVVTDHRISKIWFGHKPLGQLFHKGFFAPYPIAIPKEIPVKPKAQVEGTMTLFCPPTLKKNLFNQMLAACYLQEQEQLLLETNTPVPEVLKSLLKHRQYDWLPEEKYRPLLAASSLNFACSHAETLSYQSIEAALLGVPSVGSHTVPWLPQWAWAYPDDPQHIASKASSLLGRGEEFRVLAIDWAKQANSQLQSQLERYVYPLVN